MDEPGKLGRRLGGTDLLLALALAVLPVCFDTDNCGPGVLLWFACLGAGLPVAFVGLRLMAAPRSAVVPAVLLGLLALGVGGYMFWTETLRRGWSKEDWLAVAVILPPLLQLPFGWLLWRSLQGADRGTSRSSAARSGT